MGYFGAKGHQPFTCSSADFPIYLGHVSWFHCMCFCTALKSMLQKLHKVSCCCYDTCFMWCNILCLVVCCSKCFMCLVVIPFSMCCYALCFTRCLSVGPKPCGLFCGRFLVSRGQVGPMCTWWMLLGGVCVARCQCPSGHRPAPLSPASHQTRETPSRMPTLFLPKNC